MFNFLVTVRYYNGITRYSTMRANTPQEACKLVKSALWIEGERGAVKACFADLV